MAVISKQDPPPKVVETVQDIMKLYKSLPPRPTIEEVAAAKSVIKTAVAEEEEKLEEISKEARPADVPEELFSVLQDFKKTAVLLQSHEQRKEADHMVEVDRMFEKFDGLIQRASELVSGRDSSNTQKEKVFGIRESGKKIEKECKISDESLTKRKEIGELEKKIGNDGSKGLVRSSSTKGVFFSGEKKDEKLSLMKMAAVIENSAKTGAVVLDLRGKLGDQIEWLPISIGKLKDVAEIDLSENRIMALPSSLSSLKSLKKLDIHSNQLINLPDSFGDLNNLTDLDLRANRLKSLPPSFGNLVKLVNLDLSSNEFTHLPDCIGSLISLRKLDVETNELEELPYTIGNCTSLVELRLDFNQIKALPEGIGKLQNLEIVTLHYNRVRALPTTMGNLSHLKELDVSFNELDSVPESLCFAVSLKKLNLGNNFADLRELPRAIGNLEMLEELDISDDQIRVLPESFRFLSKLRVFRADETPLEIPPRDVASKGAQAVVEYMNDLVTSNKDPKSRQQKMKKKGLFVRLCSMCLRSD